MNTYVLGAGVSRCVGYPVGTELFDEMDRYVRESGNLTDRFNYREDWVGLHDWLKNNVNPTIKQAYRTRNIEHLFTILDFATVLRDDALWNSAFPAGDTKRTPKASAEFDAFDKEIQEYQQYRSILLWALEHYFAWRHQADYGATKRKEWATLKALAEMLKAGDVVISFNYDATLERVLLDQGKWSCRDGYGFELVFQKSRYDSTRVPLEKSQVVVLHLHGATGWYRRPTFAPGYQPIGGGAVPAEVFGAAPMETNISLDPQFLKALGIFNVDACLPDTLGVRDERHVVIHPSFLKDYETDESDSHVLPSLWKKAEQALRDSEHTYIIGYSLPKADVASFTLFLETPRRGQVTVVNRDKRVMMRLGRLFSGNPFAEALSLEQWLAIGAPTR